MSEAARSAVLGQLRRTGILLAGVGGLALLAGLAFDRGQFFRSYLLGFLFVALLAVGCLGLALLSQLTGGLWGLVPRRLHEAAARTLPWLGLLFVPVLVGLGSLYPWANAEAVQADALLREKALYLNRGFFVLRAALYFAVWGVLAYGVSAWSRQQDRQPLESRASRLRSVSAVGLVVLFLTATFASVDWGMSLAPHWFSTLYGVLFIVAAGLGALSFTIVLLARLSAEEPWRTAVTPTTVHDLGKLLLAFTMLWGYVNFSQFLIIWSGNVSEETPFYVRRMHGAWGAIALSLVVFHFALPFALLLSRALKRNARALARVAGLMLLMQLVDLYWLIGPDLAGHGEVRPAFHPHLLDLAAVLGLLGLWLVLFVRQLDGAALLPLGEPQIRELTNGAGPAPAEAH
jgi:hypothetical protein